MLWELPELPSSTAPEDTDRWAWEAITAGLAACKATAGAGPEDDDDDDDECGERSETAKSLIRTLNSFGPTVLKRFEDQLAQCRTQLASMESTRSKATEAARQRRELAVRALQRVEAREAAGDSGRGEESEAKAADGGPVHALEEERRYLLQAREAMIEVQRMAGHDVEAAVQAAQGLSSRVEAGLGEYTELEAWVASATSTSVTALRTRVAAMVEERLEDMGWGQAMVQVQRREEGEEGKVPLATLLLWLVRLQRAAGREPGLECGLWAAEELAKPILLRHTFHFQGQKATAQADGGEWGLTFLTRAAHATAPALLSGAHNLDTVDAEARSLFPSSLGPMRGPSVLGAYMLGHVARAARSQATTLLQHAWDDDQDVLRVVEQVLGFDRSLEEDLAYPTAGLPAPPPLTWPTAAEALWCTPDRLGRWCGLDLGLVTRRLQEAWEEKGAWGDIHDPTDTPADGVSPPPAAQAFGGAVAFLLERYRPLRDRKTLKELVIKVLKPAIRLFLNRLYEAVKGVELERAAAGVGEGRQADFEHAWAAHCRVITTARFALDVLDDASDSPVLLRLDATLNEPAKPTPNTTATGEEGGGKREAVRSLAASAVTSLTHNSEALLNKVVESSSSVTGGAHSIIGPTRVIKAALGSIRDAVKPMASPGASPARPTPPSPTPPPHPSSGRDGPSPTPSGTQEGGLFPRPNLGEENLAVSTPTTTGASTGTSERVHPSSTPSLSFESMSLHGLWDAMIEDATRAARSAFLTLASSYLSSLPPSPGATPPQPSPSLLPPLALLDSALHIASRTLEGESRLRLSQGLAVGLVEALGARIRALRSVGHTQGMQLHTDMHALAGVLCGKPSSVGPPPVLPPAPSSTSGSIAYLLRGLLELTSLLAMPTRSLHALAEVVVALGEGEGNGEAQQLREALDAKGLATLSPMDVIEAAKRRSRAERHAAQANATQGSGV